MTKEQHDGYLKLRDRLWAMTEGRCWYCGEEATGSNLRSIDHVIPRGEPGSTEDESNLVGACMRCNGWKGTYDLETFRQRMARIAAGWPIFSPVQDEWLKANAVMPPIPSFKFYFERVGIDRLDRGNRAEHPDATNRGFQPFPTGSKRERSEE